MLEKCSTIRIDYTLNYGDLIGSLDPQADLGIAQELMEMNRSHFIAVSFIKFIRIAFMAHLPLKKLGSLWMHCKNCRLWCDESFAIKLCLYSYVLAGSICSDDVVSLLVKSDIILYQIIYFIISWTSLKF